MHAETLGRLLRAASLALAVGACGQTAATQPATTPAAASPAATAAPTQAPTAAPPAPTPLNPAPPDMLGKWTAEDDVATITISATGMRIVNAATADVRLEVIGDELVLSHSQLCTGEGRYRWSIEGDTLRFDSIEPDPCEFRSKSLDGVAYTRAPG